MSSKESRQRLAEALAESRRAEKEIIDVEARKDNEQAERIVDLFQHTPEDALR